MIHRVDAEIVAGRRTPMDPALSADGVDEALRIMYGGLPDWGSFTPIAGKTRPIRRDGHRRHLAPRVGPVHRHRSGRDLL